MLSVQGGERLEVQLIPSTTVSAFIACPFFRFFGFFFRNNQNLDHCVCILLYDLFEKFECF